MESLRQLLQINWIIWFIELCVLLMASVFVIELFDKISHKFGIESKISREKREQKELLDSAIKSIKVLSKKQEDVAKESDRHDNEIMNSVAQYVHEIQDAIKETQKSVQQISDSRVHDRMQSLEIQKQLTESIKTLTDDAEKRDQKIEALMQGNMELLGDKIDQRYSKYIALGGIPESETDEFAGIFAAYHRLGGNHKREEKYNYVKDRLPVIPVKTEMVRDDF